MKENEQPQTEVGAVENPSEFEIAAYRMMYLKFNCIVQMYDSGQIQCKGDIFYTPKPLPPKYFKSETKFTMEFVEDTDALTIGNIIKNAFNDLKKSIKDYEQERTTTATAR